MDRLLAGECVYSFYGLIIKVCCEGERIDDELKQFFNPFPFEKLNTHKDPAHIELAITVSEIPHDIPPSASEPVICYDLSLYEIDDYVYLTDGLSVFKVQPQSGKGVISLHRSFSDKPIVAKTDFFLIGFVHLFSGHGFYGLHGAGLVSNGKGYLVLGESGSGKSSVTLSLVRQGWHYQSDDALLLRESSEGIESLAFRKQFYIDPQAVRQYPEIASHLDESGNGENKKHFLDMQMIYPELFSPVCFPKVLMYTRVVSHPESSLIPMDKISSLVNLMKQSESLYINRQGAGNHIEVLKRLVYQADSFQLLAGRDLYENPEMISSMLP